MTTYAVAESGMNWGEVRRFVVDEDTNVVVEVWAETEAEALRKADVIALALTNLCGCDSCTAPYEEME